MTAETENLMLEILKRMQVDISDIKQDIRDLKIRVGLLEGQAAGQLAAQHHTNERLDRVGDRIERIERRLELMDAA